MLLTGSCTSANGHVHSILFGQKHKIIQVSPLYFLHFYVILIKTMPKETASIAFTMKGRQSAMEAAVQLPLVI